MGDEALEYTIKSTPASMLAEKQGKRKKSPKTR